MAVMDHAAHRDHCHTLEQIPNIGPATAGDLRLLGIEKPQDLRGRDPLEMYQQLCALTATRQDPCVLDTFMAIVDFMAGAPAAPWWRYTAERKAQFGQLPT